MTMCLDYILSYVRAFTCYKNVNLDVQEGCNCLSTCHMIEIS